MVAPRLRRPRPDNARTARTSADRGPDKRAHRIRSRRCANPLAPRLAAVSSGPGWYPDPGGQPGLFRYWDGRAWSATTTTNPYVGPPTAGPGGLGSPGGYGGAGSAGGYGGAGGQTRPRSSRRRAARARLGWILAGVAVVVVGVWWRSVCCCCATWTSRRRTRTRSRIRAVRLCSVRRPRRRPRPRSPMPVAIGWSAATCPTRGWRRRSLPPQPDSRTRSAATSRPSSAGRGERRTARPAGCAWRADRPAAGR